MAKGSNIAVIGALIANFAIGIAKFIGAAITGSSAMISEGIHSLVDMGNQLLLLLGIEKSKKAADESHPFGYGKDFYFWTLIVAILLFSLGGGMSIYEGIHHLQHPQLLKNPLVNYTILGLGIIFEGISWSLAFRELKKEKYAKGRGLFRAIRKSKDPSIFVVLFEDSAALIGLVIAAGGNFLSTYYGDPIYDGIASILIGAVLSLVAILLVIESRSLLIGESAEKKIIYSVEKIASDDPMVAGVKKPLSMHFGPNEILLALDVQFKKGLPGDIETAIQRIEKTIKKNHPEIKRIFIEARLLES